MSAVQTASQPPKSKKKDIEKVQYPLWMCDEKREMAIHMKDDQSCVEWIIKRKGNYIVSSYKAIPDYGICQVILQDDRLHFCTEQEYNDIVEKRFRTEKQLEQVFTKRKNERLRQESWNR